jgi:hypothetical protein
MYRYPAASAAVFPAKRPHATEGLDVLTTGLLIIALIPYAESFAYK